MKLQGILLTIFLFALQATPIMGQGGGGGGGGGGGLGTGYGGGGGVKRDKRSPIHDVENQCSGLACGNVNVDLSQNNQSPMDGISNYRERSPVRDVENSCKGAACANTNVDLSRNKKNPMLRAKNSCTGFGCLNTCIGIECDNIKSDRNKQLSNGETFEDIF